DPGTVSEDLVRIVAIQSFCKFVCKKPGKVGSYLMAPDRIIERVSDNAGQYVIPEVIELVTDFAADQERLCISSLFQFTERVRVPDHPAGLPVDCTGDLRMKERSPLHGVQQIPAGRDRSLRECGIGRCEPALENHTGHQALYTGIGEFHTIIYGFVK